MTPKTNLLRDLPPAAPAEIFETLLQRRDVKLERIVSRGQTTPEGEWHDQEEDEWILLLAGAARLTIDGEGDHDLAPGDALLLAARHRHRIAWTDPMRPTIWLALHLPAAEGQA